MKPTKWDALRALSPNSKFVMDGDGTILNSKLKNGDSLPTESEIDVKLASMISDWESEEYVRNRRSAYPSSGDQWDMIYKDNKNSTTTHADAVEAVKTKWPKDNSGPIE